MKNTLFSFVAMFLLVLSAVSATGLVENGKKIDIVSLPVGIYFAGNGKDTYTSQNQLVSGVGYITLKNKMNTSVSVALANTGLTLDADNNLNLSGKSLVFPVVLAANSTTNITLKVNTLKNLASGDYTGNLRLVNASNPTQVFDDINAHVLVPAVEISSLSVSDTSLQKGQRFNVTVNYKNIADQTDLQNLNVRVAVYSGDETKLQDVLVTLDGDDLDTNEDVSDLNSGRSDSVKFSFQMPFDIRDKDKFTVFAEITGSSQDSSSRTFYDRLTKSLEGKVPDSLIEISKLSVSPVSLACGVNKVKINTQVRNLGNSKENVQLFLRDDRGFEKQLNSGQDVQLDRKYQNEEDFTQSVDEYVTLTDLKAGLNDYTLYAYYNDGAKTVQGDVTVNSLSCAPAPQNTTTAPVVVVPTTPSVPNIPTPSVSVPSTTPRVTLKDVSGFSVGNDWVLPAVIGGICLVIGVIVALLVIPRP